MHFNILLSLPYNQDLVTCKRSFIIELRCRWTETLFRTLFQGLGLLSSCRTPPNRAC